MVGKWLVRVLSGSKSGRKEDKQPKQVSPQPCEIPPSFHSSDNVYAASQPCYSAEEDVDKAAEVFIHKFHRNLKLQKSQSEARYQGYLARAT
ncbi:hypothetical protein SUGI_0429370 [Cryptomeria japonica]|nr:hypothetical protein SUGI_0429370 [Cryptomeria japonica]